MYFVQNNNNGMCQGPFDSQSDARKCADEMNHLMNHWAFDKQTYSVVYFKDEEE